MTQGQPPGAAFALAGGLFLNPALVDVPFGTPHSRAISQTFRFLAVAAGLCIGFQGTSAAGGKAANRKIVLMALQCVCVTSGSVATNSLWFKKDREGQPPPAATIKPVGIGEALRRQRLGFRTQ